MLKGKDKARELLNIKKHCSKALFQHIQFQFHSHFPLFFSTLLDFFKTNEKQTPKASPFPPFLMAICLKYSLAATTSPSPALSAARSSCQRSNFNQWSSPEHLVNTQKNQLRCLAELLGLVSFLPRGSYLTFQGTHWQ